MEKLNGKILNSSTVSQALYQLGLPNKYRGGGKKWTYEYWVKVVDFLSKKYKVSRSANKIARTNRRSFHW
jgi:hypothetical protein